MLFRAFGRVLLLRQRLPLSQQPQCASVFSDSFRTREFQQMQNKVRLEVADEAGFKRGVAAAFERDGLRSVFADDVKKLIYLVGDASTRNDDLELLRKVLLAAAAKSDDNRRTVLFGLLPQFFTQYFLLCKLLGDVEAGKRMWTNDAFRATHFADANSTLRLTYFQLLYNCSSYQEVVDEMSVVPSYEKLSFDEVTLAMAALARLETPEALAQAESLFNNQRSKVDGRYRGRYLFAWLAMRLKEYGIAHDLLTTGFVLTKISTNMKLWILVEVGRLEDAITLIRTYFSTPMAGDDRSATFNWQNAKDSPRKKMVCFECMKALSDATKARGDPELMRELALLCQSLDTSAALSNQTLEEMVFCPISKSGSRMRMPGRSNEWLSTHQAEEE